MIPLAMIVLDELCDSVPEVPLTDWHDAIEKSFVDRLRRSRRVPSWRRRSRFSWIR
jgi:hypothetical protein